MKPTNAEPIGAYRTHDGWCAYDKAGATWAVTDAEADELERQRMARITARKGKLA